MQPKDTEERRRAIDRVNRAYADEDYDRYERLIERYCHRFGFDGDYGLLRMPARMPACLVMESARGGKYDARGAVQ